MAKIPFDIKFRPQIESGEYKVETRIGCSVRILTFDKKGDYPIVALADIGNGELVLLNDIQGYHISEKTQHKDDLFLITPEPELSEFEQGVRVCVTKNLSTHIKDGNGREMSSTVFIDDDTAKKMAAELFDLAKKELVDDMQLQFDDEINEAYYRGRKDSKAEALNGLPRWRRWGNGACGNSDEHPIALVAGCGGIRFVSCLGTTGEKYIMLSDLKKLPGFKED